jgi:hypothetical protein
VLEAVVECPGASRSELAATLGKKPDSLSRPLKALVLIERSRKSRYWLTNNWQDALDRERTLTGEKLSARLDEQGYVREREAYRLYLAEKEESSEG